MLHASSRTIRLAGVAALAGMMMAVAILAAVNPPASAPTSPGAVRAGARDEALARALDRCATLTMPDAGCEAAWAANRRRFFRQPEPAAANAASPTESIAP